MSADGPWFPLYYERLLSSRKVRQMKATDLGIYLALIIEEWMEGGPLPDDDTELSIAGRAPIENVRRILQWCFELTSEGWQNDTLEKIRGDQLQKHERAVEAGKVGAEARWGNRKPKKPQALNSDAIGVLCDPNSIRVEESRVEESKEEKIRARMNPQGLVSFWIDRRKDRPPSAIIGKQGAAAKRICEKFSQEQIVQAAVGIKYLFPYSKGEPWDLFDLEAKFDKAMAAAHNHPEVKQVPDIEGLAGTDLSQVI